MGFVLDVAGYGARAALERIEVERRLPPLIKQTLAACGLGLDSVDHRWTGDGISVMLPTGIDQSIVLPVLIRSLAGALGTDNARSADRIRARLGIALGLVEQHATGFAGPLVVDVNRLVASRPLRSALASHDGADLAVAISDQLYHAVIRPGYPGIPGGQFSRVNVVEKEYSGPAWVWVSSRQWSSPVYAPLQPGDPRQAGPYRLVARIGRGPAGVVYLGRYTKDFGSAAEAGPGARLAAVKVFNRTLTADAETSRHLEAGTLAAGVLSDQNLTRLLDSDAGSDPAWAATAFVPGPSLAAAVAETGPLPAGTAGWLALDMARAVATLHAAGLSHGAVTPHNVLLCGDGPVLTDFGLNRAALSNGPGTAEADIVQLGCTVCYAATGRSPWGDPQAATGEDGVPAAEPDLTDCPPGLVPPLTACLSADPADRPTAAALVAWLAKVTGPRPRFWLPDAVAARLAQYQVLPTAATPPNGVRFWPRRRHGR
jgi:hypothetical protein